MQVYKLPTVVHLFAMVSRIPILLKWGSFTEVLQLYPYICVE
jgi:hypothetical protein